MTTTKATSLSKRAIDLLLRAMEARSMSLQASALHQVSRGATDAFIGAKLLVPNGHVPVVAGMDDYEDELIEATWSAELKSFGYQDTTGRWVKVAHQEIAALRAFTPDVLGHGSRLGGGNNQARRSEGRGARLVCPPVRRFRGLGAARGADRAQAVVGNPHHPDLHTRRAHP